MSLLDCKSADNVISVGVLMPNLSVAASPASFLSVKSRVLPSPACAMPNTRTAAFSDKGLLTSNVLRTKPVDVTEPCISELSFNVGFLDT